MLGKRASEKEINLDSLILMRLHEPKQRRKKLQHEETLFQMKLPVAGNCSGLLYSTVASFNGPKMSLESIKQSIFRMKTNDLKCAVKLFLLTFFLDSSVKKTFGRESELSG